MAASAFHPVIWAMASSGDGEMTLMGISPARLLLPLLALLLASGAGAQWEIQHLEPPFWWTGMQSPTLELMVHGLNIAELEPRLDYPGVGIADVHKTGYPN
jgi:hypothetical protein